MTTTSDIIAAIEAVADGCGVNNIIIDAGSPGSSIKNSLGRFETTGQIWTSTSLYLVIIEGLANFLDDWGGGGGGASELSDLTDVSLSSLANGDILVYNSLTNKWVNQVNAGGHNPVTVIGNGLILSGQQLSLDIGTSSTQVAAGSHNHDSLYLGISATASDSDKLDGYDSSHFSASTHNHDLIYLGISAKASDSDKLDGYDSSYFATSTHTHALLDLTDVSIEDPAHGQLLIYDIYQNKWINTDISVTIPTLAEVLEEGNNAIGYTIDGVEGGTEDSQVLVYGQSHTRLADLLVSSDEASRTASAIVEFTSTSRGFLPPRMTTTQREAINNPANGLLVFDTTEASVYLYDSVAGKWVAIYGADKWVYKNAAYTAEVGDCVIADTSSASWNLTLPSSPSIGDLIRVTDYAGTFDSNNLIILRNGSLIHGASEDLTIDMADASFSLLYTGATTGWKLDTYLSQSSGVSMGGGAVILEASLGYTDVNTGTPVLIGTIPAGCYITEALIHIGIAFQDSGGTAVVGDVVFTVGTEASPEMIFEGDDNQPTVVEDYELEPDVKFESADLLYITPTTSKTLTQGSATVRITLCSSNTSWVEPPFCQAVFLGGGEWTCTENTGGSKYTVEWNADITVTSPETSKKITIAAASIAALSNGDFLYVTPIMYPLSDETLTMSAGATVPADAIIIATIVSGGIFVVPTWQENGSGGGGGDTVFDKTITTDSAASGGTCTGSILLGVADGTFNYFHVKANSACRSAVIQWYADAAMTDRVYNTAQRDPYTDNGHEDWTPGSLTRATPLVGGLIYYKITNYSAVASTFIIHIRGTGR